MSADEGISGNSPKRRGSENRRVLRKIFDSLYSPKLVEGVFCELLRPNGVLQSLLPVSDAEATANIAHLRDTLMLGFLDT